MATGLYKTKLFLNSLSVLSTVVMLWYEFTFDFSKCLKLLQMSLFLLLEITFFRFELPLVHWESSDVYFHAWILSFVVQRAQNLFLFIAFYLFSDLLTNSITINIQIQLSTVNYIICIFYSSRLQPKWLKDPFEWEL